MVKVIAAGSNEFVVGFQLAGIKETVEIEGNAFEGLKKLKSRKDAGIIIVEDSMVGALDGYQKIEIESSIEPVFIPVSSKEEQEGLKKLIKKSVGVDLWK